MPARRHTAAAFAAAAALSLAGCATKIDHGKAESLVTKFARGQGAGVKNVVCPSDKTAKKGERFGCRITGTDASTGIVAVTEKDDKGQVVITSRLLDPSKAEAIVDRAVQSQVTDTPVSTTCPEVLVAKAGRVFTCAVTGRDGSKGDATITQNDALGNVRAAAPFVHSGAAERQMAATVKRRASVTSARVTCPDIIVSKAGATFGCKLVADGQTAKILATQTDGDGGFTYRVQS